MNTTDTAAPSGNAGNSNGDTAQTPIPAPAAPVTPVTQVAAPTPPAPTPVATAPEVAPDSAAAQVSAMSPEEKEKAQLESLKKKAGLMGITFSNNIGLEALQAKIAEKTAGDTAKAQQAAPAPASQPNGLEAAAALSELPAAKTTDLESKPQPERQMNKRQKMMAEQMKLIRCHIVNLDPKKKDLPGEIISVANEVIGNVRKFVPFGESTEGGYHIPYVLYKVLLRRKFLQIRTRRDPRTGANVVTQAWVKEFAITVMDPLTRDELNQLAQAQIAAGSIEA